MPANRPRIFAGAISEIYIGPTTEDAPTAMPPKKRNKTKINQEDTTAQPIADSKYRAAIKKRIGLRPYFCVGFPIIREPNTVPIKLEATVKPSQKESNSHNF